MTHARFANRLPRKSWRFLHFCWITALVFSVATADGAVAAISSLSTASSTLEAGR